MVGDSPILVGPVGFVIAQGGPEQGIPQQSWVDLEDSHLVLRIGPGIVSIVTEHQPHVRVVRAREVKVTIADLD